MVSVKGLDYPISSHLGKHPVFAMWLYSASYWKDLGPDLSIDTGRGACLALADRELVDIIWTDLKYALVVWPSLLCSSMRTVLGSYWSKENERNVVRPDLHLQPKAGLLRLPHRPEERERKCSGKPLRFYSRWLHSTHTTDAWVIRLLQGDPTKQILHHTFVNFRDGENIKDEVRERVNINVEHWCTIQRLQSNQEVLNKVNKC